jgi:3-hydroxyisobutyrate dehydrogenase-like beta-hydroxyacid dehydrogenase
MAALAFLGLGTMGAPMARRLAAVGELTVWNRSAARVAEVAGAAAAPTPAAAAAAADVIVTMVSDGAALNAIVDGPEGILAGARPGALLIDMSTIGPAAARATAARCAERDVGFLDAPVSGSVALATAGTLTTMVGGPRELFERARPLLAAMTRAQLHLGGHGAGAAMKVALNLALAVTNQAVAETLALAEAEGIRREDAYEALASGALGSPYVAYKRAAFLDPEGAPVAFPVAMMRKDVALAQALARDQYVPIAVGDAVALALDALIARGLGERDVSSALSAIVAPD